MALNADTLLDRLYLKNQITRWRLLAVVTVVLALVAIFERSSPNSPIEGPFIARVTIQDIVLDDMDRDELLAEIRDNPKIKALIVRLDTPGGSAVAGMETYLLLREIAMDKPVVAVMRDLSASAGYLIAIGADRIYAREATLTGSIGVIIQTAEFTGLAEKLGITPITVKTGALKDSLSPYAKASPEALKAMQTVIDDFFQVFIDTVASRRKLPREEVETLADGRVFTGRQAVQNKLIDAIGSEGEAVAWMEKERQLTPGLEIKEMEPSKPELPWLERIANSAMQKISPNASGTLDGLVAIWHPSVQIQ